MFDATNFFTFLIYHDQDDLVQNGYSKEGRANLRIINVSKLSTLDDKFLILI